MAFAARHGGGAATDSAGAVPKDTAQDGRATPSAEGVFASEGRKTPGAEKAISCRSAP